MTKKELEKYLGRTLTKKEYEIEYKKFLKNFCRPETEEEKKEARRERRRKPLGEYEVCEYILDWEPVLGFDNYEDAKSKAIELCKHGIDIAIFKDGILITEYKP